MASVGPATIQVPDIEAIDDIVEMTGVMTALGLSTKGHKSMETMQSAVLEFYRKRSAKESSLQADKVSCKVGT